MLCVQETKAQRHQLVGPDFFRLAIMCVFGMRRLRKVIAGWRFTVGVSRMSFALRWVGPSLTKRAVMWRRDSEI